MPFWDLVNCASYAPVSLCEGQIKIGVRPTAEDGGFTEHVPQIVAGERGRRPRRGWPAGVFSYLKKDQEEEPNYEPEKLKKQFAGFTMSAMADSLSYQQRPDFMASDQQTLDN